VPNSATNLTNLSSSGNGLNLGTNNPSGFVLNALTSLTGAHPTFRLFDAEGEIASGVTSINGSFVGVRGNITQDASGTLGSGSYVYGVQGKATLKGTLNTGSGMVAGLFGQLDTSAITADTSSHLAAVIADMGATSPLATDGNAKVLALFNTTNCLLGSVIYAYANASFFMDLTDPAYGGANWAVLTTAATAAGTLKVKVNGNTRYIQLYSSAS
jgi:hypothetical protein